MDTSSEDNLILIYVYGSWGSELQTTANNMDEAHKKAKEASEKNPKNEYCIELEPGGFDNPIYKGGVKIQG